MNLNLSILTLLLLSVIGGKSQSFWLKGRVMDEQQKTPLAGVSIHTHTGISTLAKADGSFALPLADTSKPTILHFSFVGFEAAAIIVSNYNQPIIITLKPTTSALEDVVVSGNLKPMRRLESPIPVESYTQTFLKANPTPSLFESMMQVNGIQPQLTCNVCNTGEIRINGMDGAYTMVLIDGMPIVSSLSTIYGLSGIPNSIIKRIEVVKGPASTLYGSEAVGGIINIITQDAFSTPKFSTDINISSIGETSADLSSRLHWKKATGLLGANLFYYNTPQDVNNDNFTDVTLQQRFSLFNKWDWENRQGLHHSIAARLLAEYRWGGEMNFDKAFAGGDRIYGENINTRRAELIGKSSISKQLLLEYSYNYHWQNSYYGTTWYKASQHTAFAQLRWQKQVGIHQLLAGLPIRLLHYDDNTVATQKPDGNKPSLQQMTGIYVQNEIKWNNKLTSLTGIRYEYNNLQGGVVAPRVALKWHPANHHTVRLSGGNGFRIVNLYTEDHAALSGFREIVIKNDLKPEKSWNGNLNYSGDFHFPKGILGFDVSAFFTWFANKILPDYDTDPQKIIYDNLDGHAISKGISAAINLTLNNGIRAGNSFTWMQVFNEEAEQRQDQIYAPKWSGNYSLFVPWKKAGINLDLTGKWTGPMRLPTVQNDFRSGTSPWYNLTNIQLTKKWNNAIETYVAVKNLFNFLPANPILHPDDPFDRPGGKYWNSDGTPNQSTNPNAYTFDPSYNYAPMQRLKVLAGVRCTIK